MSRHVPKYRRHPNGQAFVQHRSIPTPDHRLYLGKYDSEDSRRRYRRFLARLEAGGPAIDAGEGDHDRTVSELIVLYLDFAERYYAYEGQRTNEFLNMVAAIRPLDELYGDWIGGEFSPRCLVAIQEHLIHRGHCRTGINARVGRIKRFFRWCCQQEHVPGNVVANLLCVSSLRRGRSGAKEAAPVEAVGRRQVEPVLPFLSPQVGALVQAQFLCGMRPGEATIMRRCDLDTTGDIWLYRPSVHKGGWRGRSLVKAVPRRAQAVIQPFFKHDLEAFLFSPYDVEPTLAVRAHYDAQSYRQAVDRGIVRARRNGCEVERWTPNQLRHGIATEVSRTLGQQAAQRWLGHASLRTTDIYVEREIAELVTIARELDRRWAS